MVGHDSTNYPAFPQESPAIQYIVQQVAMMHDAASCSRGYYKSHEKVIQRVTRIDGELDALKQCINVLNAHIELLAGHTDSRKVAEYFKTSLDVALSEIGTDARNKAKSILIQQTHRITETANNMEKIVSDINIALSKINKENALSRDAIDKVCIDTVNTQNKMVLESSNKIAEIIAVQESLVSQSEDIRAKLGKDIHASDKILFLIIFISIAAGITIGELIRFGLGLL